MTITFLKSWQTGGVSKDRHWTNQEVADFYRAVDLLKEAGLNTEVDSGLTDEGDPWFVFIRPENGDVIAHFARINGEFLAVSAVNQEVYKGPNIRVIVDRMLERYPALLPQKTSDARILLHPTAAISAFLAAAFILTIDGVKATSLTEIMVKSVVYVERELDSSLGVAEGSQKNEQIKNGFFSDLSSSNYHVAILGAALIAAELSSSEMLSNALMQLEKAFSLEVAKKSTEHEENEYIVPLANESQYAVDDSYFVQQNKLAVVPQVLETNIEETNATLSKGIGNSESSPNQEQSLGDILTEQMTVSNSHYQKFWSGGDLVYKMGVEALGGKFDRVGSKELGQLIEFEVSHEQNGDELGFKSLLEGFQDFLKKTDPNSKMEFLPLSNKVNIELKKIDSPELLPLYEVQVDNNLLFLNKGQIFSLDGKADSNSHDSLSHSASEFDGGDALVGAGKATPDEVVFDSSAKILGHSFYNPSKPVILTEAIDVVFYSGGNAEISQFELGKDLLWFFLSSEELEGAENYVNQSGDLVLDFGSIGTLKFLGVVAEDPLEVVI